MDLASKIKGKLPHIFGAEEEDDVSSQEAEESAGEQEAEAETAGGEMPHESDEGAMMHAKALSKHLKAGNHAGVIEAVKGIMKSGKGNLESKGGGS